MRRELPNRKLNRLRGYNYTNDGWYFVTICTNGKIEYFGEIKNETMQLNEYGKTVKQQWKWLGKQYKYIYLDEFIVMPNHLHGIVAIDRGLLKNYETTSVGTGHDVVDTTSVGTGRDLSLRALPPQQYDLQHTPIEIKSLSELIGAFKTTSSKQIHRSKMPDFHWQRSFYDHIIRNEIVLDKIRKYIIENPTKWHRDRNNPTGLLF